MGRMNSEKNLEAPDRLPGFWDRLKASERPLLSLDYDGTLAPFKVDRMEAEPLEGITDVIRKIQDSTKTTVMVTSGRPLPEVTRLLGDLGVTVVGSHGYEVLDVNGDEDTVQPTSLQKIGLRKGRGIAVEHAADECIEEKVAAIAVHTRPLAEGEAERIGEEVFREWADLADVHNLECVRFNGGVELRSPGRDKGAVLLRFMRMNRSDFTVHIGDDETDEDAFEVVRNGGVGIKVGEPEGETQARALLKDCEAVRDFLYSWLDRAGL